MAEDQQRIRGETEPGAPQTLHGMNDAMWPPWKVCVKGSEITDCLCLLCI